MNARLPFVGSPFPPLECVFCAAAGHSQTRPKFSFDTTSVSRHIMIHLFNVDMPTPKSSATYLRMSPLVRALGPSSFQHSSVYFCLLAHLLCSDNYYQKNVFQIFCSKSVLTYGRFGEQRPLRFGGAFDVLVVQSLIGHDPS